MSKFLNTAAVVVGAIAFTVATAGALGGPAAALATSVAHGIGFASSSALATVLGATCATCSVRASLKERAA